MGRLEAVKRVDHALRAVAQVRGRGLPVELDVCGSGTRETALQSLVADLGVTDRVRFHGHVSDGARRFHEAEFSVLCSTFEGQGLVVLESMAAGCIPVSYDMPFGPGEIIEHGVSGFLVPNGDEEALADTIAHVISLPAPDKERIRRAGIARVSDFSPDAIYGQWAESLVRARSRNSASEPAWSKAVLDSAEYRSEGVRRPSFVLRGRLAEEVPTLDVRLSYQERKQTVYGRVPVDLELDGDMRFTATIHESKLLEASDGWLDLSLDFLSAGGFARTRIAAGKAVLPCSSPRVDVYATKLGYLSARIFPNART